VKNILDAIEWRLLDVLKGDERTASGWQDFPPAA